MKRDNLNICREVPPTPPQAIAAVEALRTDGLRRNIAQIYKKTHGRSGPRYLMIPPVIMPLSPEFGMGLEVDPVKARPIVHIDGELLDKVLTQEEQSVHYLTAQYFILSAAGYSFIRDTQYMKSYRRNLEDDHLTMHHGWKWAGRLALNEMHIGLSAENRIVQDTRRAVREEEEEYLAEMLFFTHKAAEFDVAPPRIIPVRPWIGIAFPESTESIQDRVLR